MKTQNGFTLFTPNEFVNWIAGLRVARTVLYVQEHHTYSPDYRLFNGSNHFQLQSGMKNYHVYSAGFSDIAQHFTIFPDGQIMTGRSMESSPAGIYGNNSNAICIENIGNFDTGKDSMTKEQSEAIIAVTASLCKRFSIPINTDGIVYHHWFRLNNGVRNNGAGGNKSCPGTAFFGGNKVADCEANFLPLVRKFLNKSTTTTPPSPSSSVDKYVVVTASSLNVRTGPSASSPKVADRDTALQGSILRVYEEKNDWLRISNSNQHWVSGKYTQEVKRAKVTAGKLNVRNTPSAYGLKVGSLVMNQEVFVYEESKGWSRVESNQRWVSSDYLEQA